uniref:Ig-like domain-containing protein n=1 Tax=Poecilia reticulata TaxID=8081 RepID=A0A3P9N4F7_POERE
KQSDQPQQLLLLVNHKITILFYFTVHHSLQYIYTASSGIKSFPEFVAVGLVDGTEVMYYDSNIKKAIPKQDWMRRVTEAEPKYWDFQTHELSRTQICRKSLCGFCFSGVHIFQNMYGCEMDDEYREAEGWESFGYDGEDFIAFDLITERWSAPVSQALITKNKWDNDKMKVAEIKYYITQTCPDWLKKYLKYGKISLLRTGRTIVWSILTLYHHPVSSSSPISCLATGFYPNRAEIFWRKDGVEIHEDVNKGEILPNNDGTFQMSVNLDLSSISSDDWMKYECVFQLSGLKEDLVTKLETEKIRTNRENSTFLIFILTGVAMIVVPVCAACFYCWIKKGEKSLNYLFC